MADLLGRGIKKRKPIITICKKGGKRKGCGNAILNIREGELYCFNCASKYIPQ